MDNTETRLSRIERVCVDLKEVTAKLMGRKKRKTAKRKTAKRAPAKRRTAKRKTAKGGEKKPRAVSDAAIAQIAPLLVKTKTKAKAKAKGSGLPPLPGKLAFPGLVGTKSKRR